MTATAAIICDMAKAVNENATGFGAFQSKLENKDESQKGTDKWELVHWPIKCRCNFVRLVLEESNIDYVDSFGQELCAKQIQSVMMSKQKPDPNRFFESMGPPFIRKFNDQNVFISQSIIMTQYAAEIGDLRPKCPIKNAQAGMIVANCVDIFEDIKAMTTKAKFNPNKEQAKQQIFGYVQLRLDRWMKILEKPLKRVYKGNDEFYVFDNRITQCDLAIFNILDGIEEWLGNELTELLIYKKYPLLKKHQANMYKNSQGVRKLIRRQKQMKVLWWPYYGTDAMGIVATREWLKQKYLSSSKL